jgi:ABC-type glutathione transport system ATPase component
MDTLPLLAVRGVTLEFRKTGLFSASASAPAVEALDDISFILHRQTTLAVIGESGAGKSSLARCIALLEKPTGGEILFEGQNVLALNGRELLPFRRAVQLVFQDPTSSLNPRFTAAEIVSEPLVVQGEDTAGQRQQKALELMDQVGLSAKWSNKRPLEFSGGQRQRLAIARALSLNPRLIIFDEALSSLDIDNQELILQLLDTLQQERSLTYIHITHDLNLVSRVADEIAVMHQGRIVEHKPASILLERQENSYARELFSGRSTLSAILDARFAEVAR